MNRARSPTKVNVLSPAGLSGEKLQQPLLGKQVDIGEQVEIRQLLVLGCGDSGKTTLTRQLMLLANGPFDPETIESAGFYAAQCLLHAIRLVGQTLGPNLPSDLHPAFEIINDQDNEGISWYSSRLSDAMRKALRNESFAEAFFGILDSNTIHPSTFLFARRFLDCPNWGSRTWRPTSEYVLDVNVRTSGVVEYTAARRFGRLKLADTGGQRCERKKWVHFYPLCDAIVYVASLADYHEVLYEDSYQNRLSESLDVFETICNNVELADRPLFLVLNKLDLLDERLVQQNIPLNTSGRFPNAPVGHDVQDAVAWVTREFLNRRQNPNRVVFVKTLSASSMTAVSDLVSFIESRVSPRHAH